VFNSDIICEYPLQKLEEFHKSHGKEVSIMVKEVEDPSKYGVIIAEEDGRIIKFVEKPKEYVGNKINAGIYIFNNSIIDKIDLRYSMLEKDIFPKLAEEGNMYSMNLSGFWMDIG
jgi:mannose-1-phosphate guanylyltransferase